MKRILLFSTFDWGGAGESMVRIARALRELNYEVILVVKEKTKSDSFIIQAPDFSIATKSYIGGIFTNIYDRIYSKLSRVLGYKNLKSQLRTDYKYAFGNRDENNGIADTAQLYKIIGFQPDLIIFGWVTYFLNTKNIKELSSLANVPTYWLTTDMAPLTGGCHYAWDCPGYKNDCQNCPAILTSALKQLAYHNLKIKFDNLSNSSVKILAGSEWCHKQAKKSTLFRHQDYIPVLNGFVDKNIFNSSCRDIAKQVFGVSTDKKLIFTGSTFTGDERKGIKYLVEALNILNAKLGIKIQSEICILIAGNDVLQNEFVRQIPFKVVPCDFIKDDRLLSLAYQASDLFICSSIEDSGPMMVNESLACGTPVVGFDLGFVSDIVIHGENGYRVPLKNTVLMAQYIQNILLLDERGIHSFSCKAVEAIDKKVSLEKMEEIISELMQ